MLSTLSRKEKIEYRKNLYVSQALKQGLDYDQIIFEKLSVLYYFSFHMVQAHHIE